MKYPTATLFRSALVLQAAACAAFAEYSIKVLQESPAEIRVNFSMGPSDYSIAPIAVNGAGYSRIRLEDAQFAEDKGSPDVPQASLSVAIPDRSKMAMEILASESREVDADPVAPSKGTILRNVNPESVPYEFGDAYRSGARYPEAAAYLGTPHIAGDIRSNVVYFQPFQYDFKTGKLRIFTSVTVRIFPTGEPGINERRGASGGALGKTAYQPVVETGGMLIISHQSFLETMKPFVRWKNKRGIKTEIVDAATIGDAAAIKTYVADQYRTKGKRYLLLVGDWDKVPSLQNGGPTKDDQGPSDLAYGTIEGNDAYPEMMVGRFSGAETRDIQAQVDKSLFYERSLKTTDSWLRNASAVSDNSEDDDKAAIDYIVASLKKTGYPTAANSISKYDASADENKLITDVNKGVGVHFNASHGDETSIVNLNLVSVGKMANQGKYPFNFTSACNPGTFNTRGDCLGEALLKKPNAGFVGAYMASILTPWYEPYVALKEQADVLARKYPDNIKKTYGAVAISGNMKMIDKYPKTGPWVSNALILFGDPSLQLYTDQPAPIVVTHPAQIGTGAQVVNVTGTEGATVCLYRAKSGILAVQDITGGKASFPSTVQADAADTLFITGTLTNHETYEGTIALTATTALDRRSDRDGKPALARTTAHSPVFFRKARTPQVGEEGIELFNAQGKSLP